MTKPESTSLACHGIGCYSNLGAAQTSSLHPYNKIEGDLICAILISKVWLTLRLGTHFFNPVYIGAFGTGFIFG